MLRFQLPKIGKCIHDVNEQVRGAVLELAEKLKSISGKGIEHVINHVALNNQHVFSSTWLISLYGFQ